MGVNISWGRRCIDSQIWNWKMEAIIRLANMAENATEGFCLKINHAMYSHLVLSGKNCGNIMEEVRYGMQ